MIKVECPKCKAPFEGKTKKKAMKKVMMHAKKYHTRKETKEIYRILRKKR